MRLLKTRKFFWANVQAVAPLSALLFALFIISPVLGAEEADPLTPVKNGKTEAGKTPDATPVPVRDPSSFVETKRDPGPEERIMNKKLLAEAEDLYAKGDFEGSLNLTKKLVEREDDIGLAVELAYEAQKKLIEIRSTHDHHKIELDRFRSLDQVDKTSMLPRVPKEMSRPGVPFKDVDPNDVTPRLLEQLKYPISFNLSDAPLRYILDLLFRTVGCNIIYDQSVVQGKRATIHVEALPLEQVLKEIARNHALDIAYQGDILLITAADAPKLIPKTYRLQGPLTTVMADDFEIKMVTGTGQAGNVTGFKPNQETDLEKILNKLASIIDWPQGSEYYLDKKRNLLFVKTTLEAHKEVERIVKELDQPPLQVLIETRFIEVGEDTLNQIQAQIQMTSPLDFIRDHMPGKDGDVFIGDIVGGLPKGALGTNFGVVANQDTQGGSLSFTSLAGPDFKFVLNAIATKSDANTLSAPKIIALNNYPATISLTKDLIYIENYTVDRSNVTIFANNNGQGANGSSDPILIPTVSKGQTTGITLTVTPSIGNDRKEIYLGLEPEVSEKVGEETIPFYYRDANNATQSQEIHLPIKSVRTLRTKLAIRDGSTVMLGGLITDNDIQTVNKVPLLGDLPYIGWLFRTTYNSREKRNLLIFVTATIIRSDGGKYNELADMAEVASGKPEESK